MKEVVWRGGRTGPPSTALQVDSKGALKSEQQREQLCQYCTGRETSVTERPLPLSKSELCSPKDACQLSVVGLQSRNYGD